MFFKFKLTGMKIYLHVYRGQDTEIIEINNGFFDEIAYSYLVIVDNKVFLERGNNLFLLQKDVDGLIIEVESPLERLVRYFDNPEIYVSGVSAIPEEKLKEAVQVLIS